ncbi:MAG TPA: M48 family metallopeptidase [Chloroflexota bacterium]|nr:M48 family metallopeptidase [Chloroflexota bacterium]
MELDAEVSLDPERQRQARRYSSQRRAIALAELAIAGVYLGGLILAGETNRLRDAAVGLTGGRVASIALFFLVIWAGYLIISLPLGIVSGWMLPRRYGMSVQTFGQWCVDWLKGETIAIVIGAAMIEVVYALLLATPAYWWLVAGVLYLAFVVGMANLAPILLLPLFYKLTPLDLPNLEERLETLAREARVRVRGVFRMNLSAKTTAANAALMGLGNTRRVVLGDTLLDNYSSDEIAVVFAHELGHHVHGDVPRLIGTQAVATVVGLYLANIALSWGAANLGYRGIADVADLPLLILILGVVSAATAPLLNGLSRKMERAADWYALSLTQMPGAFISTMTRLANQNLAEYQPAPWVEVLFYDHPSIANRVRLAQRFAHERGVAQ